ncbi:MAG: hypothetical protein N2Z62_14375 [Rhodobacteraceae bacterium]|nr:hypothetical protein [Paracoccaceae bacterium]
MDANLAWRPWNPAERTPYVDWWYAYDALLRTNRAGFVPAAADPFRPRSGRGMAPLDAPGHASEVAGSGFAEVPVPAESRNPHWPADGATDWTPPELLARLPDDVPADAVIVGIIDTGVALGHRAFRRAGGSRTRVIAAWQQTATWGGQGYLPFGQELYARDIDAALAAHSRGGDPRDRLDEEGFNRALRLVEPERIRGHRDLDFRAAHGTHIMDLATGFDPVLTDRELLERVRIIVVNLPPQFLHGTAGHFLEFFAAFAADRIVSLAGALWRRLHGAARPDGAFPVAINLAYGMQAGPKDGSMPLERMFRDIVRARPAAATTLCLPAGNSNLARGNATVTLRRGVFGPRPALRWRIPPSDRSSNFLEIWSENLPRNRGPAAGDFVLRITPPDGPAVTLPPARASHFLDLAPHARIYCEARAFRSEADQDRRRVRFVLCLGPPHCLGTTPPPGPAGVWQVEVKCTRRTSVRFQVQSDQSGMIQSGTGLQSYLDDPAYRPWLDTARAGDPAQTLTAAHGAPRDSFAYPMNSGSAGWLEWGQGPVFRVGTTNALASTFYACAVAGYRVSDGRPAVYSATGQERPDATHVLPIQLAYPTEEGSAHYGILGAGARDGSSVAYRGTSGASALATRDIVAAMLTGAGPGYGASDLQRAAAAAEAGRPGHYGPAAAEKTGAGRMPFPPGYRRGRPGRLR